MSTAKDTEIYSDAMVPVKIPTLDKTGPGVTVSADRGGAVHVRLGGETVDLDPSSAVALIVALGDGVAKVNEATAEDRRLA